MSSDDKPESTAEQKLEDAKTRLAEAMAVWSSQVGLVMLADQIEWANQMVNNPKSTEDEKIRGLAVLSLHRIAQLATILTIQKAVKTVVNRNSN